MADAFRAIGGSCAALGAVTAKVAATALGAGVVAAPAFAAAPDSPGGVAEAWTAVSGVFVGSDGVNPLPTAIAVGFVAVVAIVGVLRAVLSKSAKPAAEADATVPAAAAAEPAAPRPSPVISAAPTPVRVAPQAAPAASYAPAAVSAEALVSTPPRVAPAKPAASASPVARPQLRKLAVDLDRKHRTPVGKSGFAKSVVKLSVVRRAVVASARKSKLFQDTESTKRRSAALPSGPRKVSSTSSSYGRRLEVKTAT